MAGAAIGALGANFNSGYTVNLTSNPETELTITPGTTFMDADYGRAWTFVKLAASQTITAGDFLYVSSTDGSFTATALSNTAKAKLGMIVGVAGATLSSGTTSYEYMWIQRLGYCASANCLSGSAANAALHTTGTAGRIDDTASGGNSAAVTGVVQLGAASASNVAAVQLTWPTIGAAD